MLDNRINFLLRGNEEVAICGFYMPWNDAVHVGLYWRVNGQSQIVDFNNGQQIFVRDANDPAFSLYYFNPLPAFPHHLIPTLATVATAVSRNHLNDFILQRHNVVYDGGEFEFVNGGFLPGTSAAERFINCGVFVVALLKSFRLTTLDWTTFPIADPADRTYLEDWLNSNNIPAPERINYYNQNRVIRGKHVLVCPSTPTDPTPYHEAKTYSDRLIKFFQWEQLRRQIQRPIPGMNITLTAGNFPKVPNI